MTLAGCCCATICFVFLSDGSMMQSGSFGRDDPPLIPGVTEPSNAPLFHRQEQPVEGVKASIPEFGPVQHE
jgi:hypothetical protein